MWFEQSPPPLPSAPVPELPPEELVPLEPPPSRLPGTLELLPSGGTKSSGGSLAHANAMPATDSETAPRSPRFRIDG